MNLEGTDTSNHLLQGIPPERAAQLSRENQAGGSGVESGRPEISLSAFVPDFKIEGFLGRSTIFRPPESDQISDCKKDKCIVGGKQYANSTDIPGNHPKALLHPDGTPVLGPDGKAVMGPDGVDMEKIAQDERARHSPLTLAEDLLKFRHSGEWDFQRRMTDDIPGQGRRPIFTKEYQNFANIAAGYILGSLGASLKDIGFYANSYCWARGCNYSEPRSPEFPQVAERQMQDYAIGVRLWNERHPEAGKNY